MAYAFEIGRRYLRSKKRRSVSLITVVAVAGVALGVAALVAVLAITTGFEKEFRDKVLGVNAHVLIMKYGVDFEEYPEVLARVDAMPEVAGAGPFLIHQTMLAVGDHSTSVLVKGVDPDRVGLVLDLPTQIVDGSLDGLRLPGSLPPRQPGRVGRDWLSELVESYEAERGISSSAPDAPDEASSPEPYEPLPEVEVATPEEVEAILQDSPLPDDDFTSFDDLDFDALRQEDLNFEEVDFDEVNVENLDFEEGEGAESALPGLVVGKTLAENLDIEVGDVVRLISPLSGLSVSLLDPEARVPRARDFRVIGIFQAGFQEYDSNLVYADLYQAQHFYGQGDVVLGVEMRLVDLEQGAEIANRLGDELGGSYNTVDWGELNRPLFTALQIQKIALSFVIANIILVAAINVIATLIMIVLEKRQEVAILKAMGAPDRTILGIFAVQGIVIGLVGTALGLLIGGGVIWYLSTISFPLDPKVYLIDHLPVVVDSSVFIATAIISVLICSTATLLPSAWAARMRPADGLRVE